MFESLVISLALTLIIETLLATIVKVRDEENLTTVMWVNVLTNPVVVSEFAPRWLAHRSSNQASLSWGNR